MDEFDLTLDKAVLDPGRVVFEVHNDGDIDHELTLVALPDWAQGVQEWLDAGRHGVIPIYSLVDREPGQRGVFAANLGAGRYALLCVMQDGPDEVPHHRQGMNADIRVGPQIPPPSTPSAEGS
ncbi:MAG: hypothetical protein WD250_07225 [Egibacteraceae bacterium]